MNASILLLHKITVSLFLLSYLVRLIGLLGNISAINNLYSKKIMRILVDMVISTLFLFSGVWMLLNMPGSMISTLLITKIVLVLFSIPLAIVGFRRAKKPLALLSVLMVLGAYSLGEINKRKPPMRNTVLSTAVNSDELFVGANCNTCHGNGGNSPVYGAKNLTQSKLTEDEIRNTILKGKNMMPSYKSRLTEKQLNDLVEYVKALQKQP